MPPKDLKPPDAPKLPPKGFWDVPHDVAAEREVVGYLPDGRVSYSRSAELDEIDEDREGAEAAGLSPTPPQRPLELSEHTAYAQKVLDRVVSLASAGAVADAYGEPIVKGDQVTLLDEARPSDEIFAVVEVAGPNLVLTPWGSTAPRPPFAVTAARCARLT